MSVAISEVAESIGWHLHGSTWVWGVAEGEGCSQCDAAWKKWIKSQFDALSTEEQLKKALGRRRRSPVAPPQEQEKELPSPMTKREAKRQEMERRQKKLF